MVVRAAKDRSKNLLHEVCGQKPQHHDDHAPHHGKLARADGFDRCPQLGELAIHFRVLLGEAGVPSFVLRRHSAVEFFPELGESPVELLVLQRESTVELLVLQGESAVASWVASGLHIPACGSRFTTLQISPSLVWLVDRPRPRLAIRLREPGRIDYRLPLSEGGAMDPRLNHSAKFAVPLPHERSHCL